MGERVALPLATNFTARSNQTAYDAKIVNGWIVPDENGTMYVEKRPGLVHDATVSAGASAGAGCGCYYWDEAQAIYSAWGNALYRNSTNLTVPGSWGPQPYVWFTELDSYLYAFTGYGLYRIDTSNNVVEVTDADYPGNVTTSMAYGAITIDGYVLVCTQAGLLHNSVVNDGTSWVATDYVSAEMESDGAVALVKHHNHAVVLGRRTTEFFANAALPTGSPFVRREDITANTGCASWKSIATYGDLCFFVAVDNNGEPYVAVLENFQIQRISTTAIERKLDVTSFADQATGCCIISQGKLLYILDGLYAYDVEQKIWYEWQRNSATSNEDNRFKALFFAGGVRRGGSRSMIQFSNAAYYLDPTKTVDDDTSSTTQTIEFEVWTPKYTGPQGTGNLTKFLSNMGILGDHSTESVTVYYSDDDYASWTSFGTLIVHPKYRLVGLGSFYERAFKVAFTANARLRVRALELEIEVGS